MPRSAFSSVFTSCVTASYLAVCGAFSGAFAAEATAPTDAANNAPITREQLPALIKEALMNDPTILTQAIDKLQAKQEEESMKKSKEAIGKLKNELYADTTSPAVGDALAADVTIVEFFDYHCGYCKKLVPAISELVEKDKKVRVVFKEFPILSEDSVLASRAALAVSRIAKDKYFDFHKAMFAEKGNFDEKTVMDEARKLGIDTVKLKNEIMNPEISAILDKNRTLGEALGVRGTPAIIIGDNLFPGAMPLEDLEKAVSIIRKSNQKNPGAK